MCILDLSNVLMYEFHYDYIKNKRCNSTLLFTDADNLIMIFKKILVMVNKYLILVNIMISQNIMTIHDDTNKLFVSEIKDETWGVAIEEFVALKQKMLRFRWMIIVSIKKERV